MPPMSSNPVSMNNLVVKWKRNIKSIRKIKRTRSINDHHRCTIKSTIVHNHRIRHGTIPCTRTVISTMAALYCKTMRMSSFMSVVATAAIVPSTISMPIIQVEALVQRKCRCRPCGNALQLDRRTIKIFGIKMCRQHVKKHSMNSRP